MSLETNHTEQVNFPYSQASFKSGQLQSLIDTLDASIILIDKNFTITRLNRSALELSNHKTYTEALGKKCYQVLFGFDSPCTFCFYKNKHDSFQKLARDNFRVDQEIKIDNQQEHFSFKTSVFWLKQYFLQDSTSSYLLVDSLVDVTLQKEQEKLNYRNAKLQTIGTTVQSIIHEIKNILLGIRLTVDQLKDIKPSSNPDIRLVKDGLKTALDIIMNIQRSVNRDIYPLYPVNIRKVIGEALTITKKLYQNKIVLKVHWLWKIDRKSPVYGDAQRLKLVFQNLFTNTFQALEQREERNKLYLWITAEYISDTNAKHKTKYFSQGQRELSTIKHHEFILINIIDSAGGISDELLKKIFDPFFSTKNQGNNAGMGLFFVNKVIEEHNSYIQVHSKGHYTRFTIRFPRNYKP